MNLLFKLALAYSLLTQTVKAQVYDGVITDTMKQAIQIELNVMDFNALKPIVEVEVQMSNDNKIQTFDTDTSGTIKFFVHTNTFEFILIKKGYFTHRAMYEIAGIPSKLFIRAYLTPDKLNSRE
jgi:hypothetical protein